MFYGTQPLLPTSHFASNTGYPQPPTASRVSSLIVEWELGWKNMLDRSRGICEASAWNLEKRWSTTYLRAVPMRVSSTNPYDRLHWQPVDGWNRVSPHNTFRSTIACWTNTAWYSTMGIQGQDSVAWSRTAGCCFSFVNRSDPWLRWSCDCMFCDVKQIRIKSSGYARASMWI